MSNFINLIGAAVGVVASAAAIVIAASALREQRKQTRVMEAQMDKRIEVKLTRDLDDSPDSTAPRNAIDATFRNYLSNRLNKVRADLRDEFNRRLVELAMGDASKEAMKVLNRQAEAVERFEASSSRMDTIEQGVQSLQNVVEDLRHGVGAPDMVQTQIRKIAELLLSATEQDRPSDGGPIAGTPSFTDTPPTFDTP